MKVKHSLFLLALLLLTSCAGGSKTVMQDDFSQFGLDVSALPDIVTQESLSFPAGSIEDLVGLSGKDVSKKDFSGLSAEFLCTVSFDTTTIWPEVDKLPLAADPDVWLEAGKDPGLGIRELHSQGITGKGVSVAVFDKPMFYEHRAFEGRVTYTEAAKNVNHGWTLNFHGIGCTSILAGTDTGVAPEATIYYFAVPDAGDNFSYYTEALESLLKKNKSLPEEQKIRIVSVSDGIGEDDPAWSNWQKAVKKAEDAGVAVLYSNRASELGFTWGGCPPGQNRDIAENYRLSGYLRDRGVETDAVILPGDFRTTAANAGKDAYYYSGNGGFSWAIPYLAGLATLAWQIEPELTFEEIATLLQQTKARAGDGSFIVDPVAFLTAVQQKQ